MLDGLAPGGDLAVMTDADRTQARSVVQAFADYKASTGDDADVQRLACVVADFAM